MNKEQTVHSVHLQIKDGTLSDRDEIHTILALVDTTDLTVTNCKKYVKICNDYKLYDLLMYHLPNAKSREAQSMFRQVLINDDNFERSFEKSTMYYRIWFLMKKHNIQYDNMKQIFIHVNTNNDNFEGKSKEVYDITDKTLGEIKMILQEITDNYNVFLAGGKVTVKKNSELLAKSMNVKDIFGQKHKVPVPTIPSMSEEIGKIVIKILKGKNLQGESKIDNAVKCYFSGIVLWYTKDKKNKPLAYNYFIQGANMGCQLCQSCLTKMFSDTVLYEKVSKLTNQDINETFVRNIVDAPSKSVCELLKPYAPYFCKSLLRTYLVLLNFDLDDFSQKYNTYEDFARAINDLFIF